MNYRSVLSDIRIISSTDYSQGFLFFSEDLFIENLFHGNIHSVLREYCSSQESFCFARISFVARIVLFCEKIVRCENRSVLREDSVCFARGSFVLRGSLLVSCGKICSSRKSLFCVNTCEKIVRFAKNIVVYGLSHQQNCEYIILGCLQ